MERFDRLKQIQKQLEAQIADIRQRQICWRELELSACELLEQVEGILWQEEEAKHRATMGSMVDIRRASQVPSDDKGTI